MIPHRRRAGYDVLKRKFVIRLHVCAQLKPLVIGQLGKASDQLLQRRRFVDVDEVIRIHLQSVLDSVGVRDDSKDG